MLKVRKMRIKPIYYFLLLFIVFCAQTTFAQNGLNSPQNLSTLKVDELNDVQLLDFITQFKSSGYSIDPT